MKALSSFILKGYSQAILVVVAGAVLAFIFPLFSLISGAAVALITLRKGVPAGATVVAASTVFIGLLGYYSLGSLAPALMILGILWLPLLIVAWILREFRSLNLAMLVTGAMGLLLIIGVYVMVGDVSTWWHEQLRTVFDEALKASGQFTDTSSLDEILARMADMMTGIVAGGMVLNTLVCLFLARSAQAMLFNPGGFRDEFYQLQLGRILSIVVLALMVLSMLPAGLLSQISGELIIVLLTLFVIQGLAVAHAIVAKRKMHVAWLVALYVIPLVFLPQLIVAIGILGLMDSWVNFRQRVSAKGGELQ